MSARQSPDQREGYRHFVTITTRWMDNDVYGHINNVVNRFLIDQAVLDIHHGDVIGLVVETHCNFFSSAAFPADIEAGIRVAHLGRSSVRYEVGLFVDGRDQAIAQGHFVHVYVDRDSEKPVYIPDDLRAVLSMLE